MNKSMQKSGRIIPGQSLPRMQMDLEQERAPLAPKPFSLPQEVEKEVISYLEHKGAVKDDFEKALDFILDLNSNFKIENDMK